MKKLFTISVLLIFSAILIFPFTSGSQTLTKANFTGVIIPQFMGSGSGRLPVVYRATVSNLTPNATYRYYNQLARYTDLGTTGGGAGNPMFMGATYVYTTSTGLATSGQYAEFTTDSSGRYTGWFCSVFTTNARFTAGYYVIPSITINDGAGGSVATARYALDDSIKVMAFATTSGPLNITGIYGTSGATGKNIICLYDNMTGSGKPLSTTYAEDEGIAVASVIAYYSSSVNGIAGAWGTLIPNDNANGIRRIEQRSLTSGAVVGCAVDNDGIWPTGTVNTANPTGGTTPLFISNTDAPLTSCNSVVNITSSTINPSKVKQGADKTVLYNINLTPSVLSAHLDSIILTTAGSYKAADVKTNGFKLWNSTDAVFDTTDILLNSIAATGPGYLAFYAPLSMNVNQTYHLFITADIALTATLGDSIFINQTPFTNIVLSSGTKTGTDPLPAGGAKLIISPSSPTISAGSVSPFGNVVANTISNEQTFIISGTNLFPASDTIKITPPSHFEVSFTSGSGFSANTIKKTYTAGTLAPTALYIIFKPTAYQSYGGNIVISGGGASAYVAVSGTGISPDTFPPEVDTAFATSLSDVLVVFNEPTDASAEITLNYSGLGTISSATRTSTLDSVHLTLATPLSPGVSKTLTINNIQDTSSNKNKMTTAQNFLVKFGTIPQAPAYQISQITKVDSKGIPDSLNVKCKITGVVQSINFAQTNLKFYLHDHTGGINVFKSTNLTPAYLPKMGDSIRVIGKVDNYYGLIEFVPDSIVVIDTGRKTNTPAVVNYLNESLEAEVVKILNLYLLTPSQWPVTASTSAKNLDVSDGIDTIVIRIERQCALQGTPAPTNLFDITGVVTQYDVDTPYFSGYQVLPRILSDLYIHPVTGASIVINELLAKSATTDSWFELYNPNSTSVSLLNYHISDDSTSLNKFKFPDTLNIPAQKYLILWDNVHPANPGIHINYALKPAGGELVLTDPSGKTIDYIKYEAQKTDTSLARLPNGTGSFFFATPTPNTANLALASSIPSYSIKQVIGVNTNGVIDSLNVNCKLTGVIYSINYRAWKPGYQFILHDGTGGINVYKLDFPFSNYPVAKMGDKIRVIGKIGQYYGLTEMMPDSIVLLDSNQTISSPVVVTKLTESSESELIRINNLTWVDTTAFPWPKPADLAKNIKATNGTDTFIIRIETECALHGKFGYTGPDTSFDIIGVGWQYDNSSPYTSGYQLYPRIATDLILHQPSGIAENGNHKLKVYPNPNNGNFYVENPGNSRVMIRIFNNLGQIVYENNSALHEISIRLDDKPGMYFIQLTDLLKSEISTARIIIR